MRKSFLPDDLSHHAYCLIGGDAVVKRLQLVLEEEHGIVVAGNQDFFYRKYEVFTIDDARYLKSAQEIKPLMDHGKRIFIISADNIAFEAQNALLKLLEEPAHYSRFFLIIPSGHILLPTVRSRLYLIEAEASASEDTEMESEARKFLALNLAKRLDYVKKLASDIAEEKRSKQYSIDFINSIQKLVYEEKGAVGGARALESLDVSGRYIGDRSSSVKILLEYMALNV